MQYTPNYNLITVEGTDVVNPLVQMNPNFTDIDAAMFANKQAVIGSATEITSGTVHSITRANPDSNYFRFTATSNWTAGDSMNVDGVTVSVYLTDGTTPESGSYVINSEVLGMISGSRVTLFVSSQKQQTASDVTYDNTVSGLTANNVQTAIDEIDVSVDSAATSISQLNDRVSANEYDTGASFTIPTDGSIVTFPSDGYVSLFAQYGTGNLVYVKIYGTTGTGSLEVHCQGNSTFTDATAVFVRRGMRANIPTITGTARADFVPLV